MCYVCRMPIGSEGYAHFCQHFRGESPGGKCMECDKCDLYRVEDDAILLRRAAEHAERLWREREGWAASPSTSSAAKTVHKRKRGTGSAAQSLDLVAGDLLEVGQRRRWWLQRWNMDDIVNWLLEIVIA